MQHRLQAEGVTPAHPRWMRWVAAFCMVLVSVMATAQVAHTHGSWLRQKSADVHTPTASGQPDSEAHCPLCSAMHSALPTAMAAELPAPAPDAVLPAGFERPASEANWAFALFSRPPPVLA